MEFFFLSELFLCLCPILELQLAELDFFDPHIMIWMLDLVQILPFIYPLDNIAIAIVSFASCVNPTALDYSWYCSLSSY